MNRSIYYFIFIIFMSVLTLPAIAAKKGDPKKSIAKCAIIKGDVARLDCFDKLSKKLGVDAPQQNPTVIKGKGKWDVNDEINPIDDTRAVTLLLHADKGQSRWKGKYYLIIRCRSNKTNFYIGWEDFLGSKAEVLTRIGKEKAVSKNWLLSTDKKATFYPGSSIGFIKKLMEHNSLLAQVTPYNESPVTAVFDTKGLSNAIKPLREACGW